MVSVQKGVLAAHDALLPLHAMLALPVHDLLAVGRDGVGRVLPVLGVVPVARHGGVERRQTEVVESLVLAVGTAPVEAHAVVHRTVPDVLWILAALPPYLAGVGWEDMIGSQLAVFGLVPLLREVRVGDGKVVGRADLHVVAIRTPPMRVRPIIWRCAIDMIGVLAAPPPDVFVRAVCDLVRSQISVLFVAPFLCNFGVARRERVGYGHFPSQAVYAHN